MNLAPIGIVTYSRINHLRQTVNSLKANDLAKESELYIFLDAPRSGDEDKVRVVRDYIYTINGFKKVYIIERETNDLIQNAVLGMQRLFDEHGKCIFMEDDNVVSKNFLQFMNDGLEFYKDDKRIMAISGHNVPAKFPTEYKHDYYKSIYFNAWGYATWADRGLLDIVSYNGQYNEMMADKKLYKKVNKAFSGLISGLKLIHEGKLNAGDYKIAFHLIKNNLYTIRPIKSYVNNIGNDGSGVHCGVNNKYQNSNLNTKKIEFIKNLDYNDQLDLVEYKYHMENKLFTKELPYRIYKKIRKILK